MLDHMDGHGMVCGARRVGARESRDGREHHSDHSPGGRQEFPVSCHPCPPAKIGTANRPYADRLASHSASSRGPSRGACLDPASPGTSGSAGLGFADLGGAASRHARSRHAEMLIRRALFTGFAVRSAAGRPPRERAKLRANAGRHQATPSDARRLSSLVKSPLSDTEPLYVPKTSSRSCDQAVFVDQAAAMSLFPDAVVVEIDRLG